MNTAAERIEKIIRKSHFKGLATPTRPRLTDVQVKEKSIKIGLFFDALKIEVESNVDKIICIIEQNKAPSDKCLDDLIVTFNHVRNTNDVDLIYTPQHNLNGNIEVVKSFIQSHYAEVKLLRLNMAMINFNAIDCESS